jgi:hypothetical protein
MKLLLAQAKLIALKEQITSEGSPLAGIRRAEEGSYTFIQATIDIDRPTSDTPNFI